MPCAALEQSVTTQTTICESIIITKVSIPTDAAKGSFERQRPALLQMKQKTSANNRRRRHFHRTVGATTRLHLVDAQLLDAETFQVMQTPHEPEESCRRFAVDAKLR